MDAIYIPNAPEAIGPYCHAMEIVRNYIHDQTKQVFLNIIIVLADLDLKLKNIVKTTVYLKYMDDFAEMHNRRET